MTGRLVEPPISRPTPAEAEAATEISHSLPTGFLAIHPGSGASRKNWPAGAFQALARTVGPTQPWLLVEGPADAACCEPLRELPNVRVARGLPPRVLGAVLARAGVYVGNDSGVSHLAAAWGAPTVALFGPTDPSVWAPIGPAVEVVLAPGGDLEALPIDQVLAAIARLAQIPRLRAQEPQPPGTPHA
jgi:heptosyltransferase-3